jgi:plasmid stability protein
MASITLKNVPEGLLKRLREIAAAERRSLNQQILYLLETAEGPEEKLRRLRVEAERQTGAWRQLSGRWQSQESVQEEISRIYASRTEGREIKL